MSQELINEITRFALAKTDEWRMQRLAMVERLGEEEAAFQICWRTYQWPTGTPESALSKFAELVSLKRLLEIERSQGLDKVGEVVVTVAREIPKFMPHMGFGTFGKFFKELIKIARENEGSLVRAFRRFNDAKMLEEWLTRLPGIGRVLAPCLVRELKIAGIINLSIENVSLSPAELVMRVLRRTGIIGKRTEVEEAKRIIREKFKVSSMALDAGLFCIGAYYCKDVPECDICPITHVCPKIMEP